MHSKTLLPLLALLLIATAGVPQVARADRYCATYRQGDYRIIVRAKKVSCRKAKRVVKSFRVTQSRGWKHRGGSTMADSYYVNRKFPGWRCAEGSGGGACHRGRRWASWEIPPP
jgi:hypothetical protein